MGQFGETRSGWSRTFGSGRVNFLAQSCRIRSGAVGLLVSLWREAKERMEGVGRMQLWAREGPGSPRPLPSAWRSTLLRDHSLSGCGENKLWRVV